MDFFADKHLKKVVQDCIVRITTGDITSSDETAWFNLTKCMLRKYSVMNIIQQLQIAICEVSDEQWFENKYPQEIFIEAFVKPTKEMSKVKRDKILKHNDKDGITAQITAKISIIGIADKHGLKPLGKKKRVCPFHADSDPSLSLDDKKGLFHCFGCKVSGNIIDFVYLLKKNNVGGIENGK